MHSPKPNVALPLSPAADAVMEALPLALLVLDAADTVRYANAAAERLLNQSATAMSGKPLGEVLTLSGEWQALLAQTQHGVKAYDLPLGATRVDAHLTLCQPFMEGEAGRLLVLEHSAAGEKLGGLGSQRHAMRSASVMAHILAHEVRNPLSGIKGAAQLLQRGANAADRELLALIIGEVERIGGLMGQVEYFSTDRALPMQAVNIHEVLRYVRDVALQGCAAEMTILEEYDPSLPPVRGNRDLLVQAILNLVKNAAEAANHAAPRITLRTSYRSGYRMMAADGKSVSLPVCVQVMDNGSGIAPELRAHIFDPFVTGKATGKGLGLAVVAKVVADHGGVLALESAEPGNTVFALQLAAKNPDR